MTIEEFDRRMALADRYRDEARMMLATADNMERQAVKEAGITEFEREPGFNRWKHNDAAGFYSTPRQALENAIKQGVA